MTLTLPPYLIEFSDRFGLYGRPLVRTVKDMNPEDYPRADPAPPDPTEAFRERAVKVLRDLAESERVAARARGGFDFVAIGRADALDRAADMVQGLARDA